MVGYHTYKGTTIRVNGQLGWDVGTERNAEGQYSAWRTFPTLDEACAFVDARDAERAATA